MLHAIQPARIQIAIGIFFERQRQRLGIELAALGKSQTVSLSAIYASHEAGDGRGQSADTRPDHDTFAEFLSLPFRHFRF